MGRARDAATEPRLLSRKTFQNFLDGANPPAPRRLELPQGEIPVRETYISPSTRA